MKLIDQVKAGDLIKAHGTRCLVLQVLPADKYNQQVRLEIMSSEGRIWKTNLDYTKWSIINAGR